VTAVPREEGLRRLVGRPGFWLIAMVVLAGGPLLSGLLRHPPPTLPVLGQLPPTGTGRLVTFADPRCAECMASSAEALRGLARHLRSVRPGFDLEWVVLGDAPGFEAGPATVIADPRRAAPLLSFLQRTPAEGQLRRGQRAVLVDARGRIRALPALGADSGELLPEITQIVNGR